jgi:NAD(P)H-nitrite reductase large subunit
MNEEGKNVGKPLRKPKSCFYQGETFCRFHTAPPLI